MKRKLIITCGIVLTCVALTYVANQLVFGETQFYRDFKRVRDGMTVEEVESLLGRGFSVNQGSVPTVVVPINPDDETASIERSKKAGTLPTVRDFPSRRKPLVEGELILKWEKDRQVIYIAFKDGKVCETDYCDWNYL